MCGHIRVGNNCAISLCKSIDNNYYEKTVIKERSLNSNFQFASIASSVDIVGVVLAPYFVLLSQQIIMDTNRHFGKGI